MTPRASIVTSLLAGLTLAGCAADQDLYPSLARRDAERISASPEPVKPSANTPATPAPPSPELAKRLDQLTAQAQAAHDKFQSREAKARTLSQAAEGAALASEPWAVATVAIADLESARSEAMIALADLDRMQADAIVAGEDATAIGAARAAVIAMVGKEDGVLAELRVRLAE